MNHDTGPETAVISSPVYTGTLALHRNMLFRVTVTQLVTVTRSDTLRDLISRLFDGELMKQL